MDLDFRTTRVRLGLTQAELADELGCERETIVRLERANRPPRNARLFALALAGLVAEREARAKQGEK